MKPTLFLCPLLTAISRAEDKPNELEMLESFIESVELEASAVAQNIHSAYSLAATAVPTDLLTEIGGLLPTRTPASDSAVDGTISSQLSCFTVMIVLAYVAAVCCALG